MNKNKRIIENQSNKRIKEKERIQIKVDLNSY